MIFINKIKQFN